MNPSTESRKPSASVLTLNFLYSAYLVSPSKSSMSTLKLYSREDVNLCSSRFPEDKLDLLIFTIPLFEKKIERAVYDDTNVTQSHPPCDVC